MENVVPSFDTWTSLFLIAVAMGVFLFILLVTNNTRKNLPIAFLVLAFSIILFQYVLFWTNYQIKFPYLSLLPPLCYFASGPLLFLYFTELYKDRVPAWYPLHFIPALLLAIPNLVMWMKYLNITDIQIPLLFLAQKPWWIVIHMSIYCVMSFYLVFTNRDSNSEYSKIRFRWGITLASLYALFILAYASYYFLVRFSFFNNQWDYAISLMMSVAIYSIGFYLFKKPEVFNGEFHRNLFFGSSEEKNEEVSQIDTLFESVRTYMEKQKPFVDNELRMVNLADQIGFSPHLLSKVINKKYGKNFNQFINDYRIHEAEKLLKEKKDLPVQQIYYEVGFNNKATFYSSFKKKYGCTPSQFRDSQ